MSIITGNILYPTLILCGISAISHRAIEFTSSKYKSKLKKAEEKQQNLAYIRDNIEWQIIKANNKEKQTKNNIESSKEKTKNYYPKSKKELYTINILVFIVLIISIIGEVVIVKKLFENGKNTYLFAASLTGFLALLYIIYESFVYIFTTYEVYKIKKQTKKEQI